MMRTSLLAVLVASSSIAAAQPPTTYEFDCDVPPGRASEWTGTVAPILTGISGHIELIEPRANERWNPVASVFLVRDDVRVGLQLIVARDAPDSVQIAVLRSNSSGGREVLGTAAWKANRVPFSMSSTKAGEVTLSVAGKDVSLGVTEFRAEKIALSCSSGQFKFGEVSVESSGD
jgi:hypothetical protein